MLIFANKTKQNKYCHCNFSKSIVVIYGVTSIILIIYTLLYCWIKSDSAPLVVLLGFITGVGVAVVNGYYKKSQAENLLKIRQAMKKQDIDTAEVDLKIDENINEDITVSL